MRTVKVRYGAWIPIGRIGENETTEVVFDISGWKETFGDNGTFEVLHQRPGDSAPYLCTIREDDNSVIWIIKNTDLAHRGHGVCNLIYTVDNKVAKSDIFTTVIGTALIGGPTPPEPWTDWVERVIEAGRKAEEAKAQWENMSAKAETLPAGTPATASYSGGVLSLGIPTGEGVPDGGTAGQLLSKTESGTKWIDPPQSAVQSDWNQNDNTAADYVKNRPFYMGDPVETVLLEETTFEFVNENSLYVSLLSESFELEIGQTYAVSWDGTIYSCVGAEFNGSITLGNLYIVTGDTDTGEPFIIVNSEGSLLAGTQDTSASHTISISCTIREIVKIDKKYLPTSYGYNLTLEDPIVENQSIGDNSTFTLPSEITLTRGDLYWANIKVRDDVNSKGQMLSRAITDDSITTAKWCDGTIILSTTGVTNNCGYNIVATIAKVTHYETVSDTPLAHQEGYYCIASAFDAHVEGRFTTASGNDSHAEGEKTTASGYRSHAEGAVTIASGDNSHAEGSDTTAIGEASHTEGCSTTASGTNSHAEGYYTTAWGESAHAEGCYTTASGNSSHAEGYSTSKVPTTITSSTNNSTIINEWNSQKFALAKGKHSHAEGEDVLALNNNSHAEGQQTIASGINSHAEGQQTIASGINSHAEGNATTANGYTSHAEGDGTTASGTNSHTEGCSTTASGTNSHAEGYYTTAWGESAHAEGHSTREVPTTITSSTNNSTIINEWNSKKFALAKGKHSHAEGENVLALNDNSHAEGYMTTASGYRSHAEGAVTIASGDNSHAEGSDTTASGEASHTEGRKTTASGTNSHAEGCFTTALGFSSHAEGCSNSKVPTTITSSTDNSTIINEWNSTKFALAKGLHSHTEGENVLALNDNSHAEGNSTTASGINSHAEGYYTTASGGGSHAEGDSTIASGTYSHAEGSGTTANGSYSHVQGKYNIADDNNLYANIVGNGTSDDARSNAHTLDWQGNAWYAGLVSVGTTTDVPTPTAANDLVTKQYVDNKVSAGSQTYTATLLSAGWVADGSRYSQTVSVVGVTASSNGSLRIAQSATDEQFLAWGAAQPRVTAQAVGTLTVKVAGTVPTIDIPVEVLIV